MKADAVDIESEVDEIAIAEVEDAMSEDEVSAEVELVDDVDEDDEEIDELEDLSIHLNGATEKTAVTVICEALYASGTKGNSTYPA